jgi:hypothetical protein
MADEFDRKMMPAFLESAFNLSLGVAFESMKAMANPQHSAPRILREVQGLFAMPSGNWFDLPAMAGNFVNKGAGWIEEWQKTGRTFGAPGKKE